MGTVSDGPAYYSPGREKQLRILLWVAVGLAALGTILAGYLVGTGYLRPGVFVAVPAGMVLALAGMGLRELREGNWAAKPWSAAAGAMLILSGLVFAQAVWSLVPSVIGILLVLMALLGDHGER